MIFNQKAIDFKRIRLQFAEIHVSFEERARKSDNRHQGDAGT